MNSKEIATLLDKIETDTILDYLIERYRKAIMTDLKTWEHGDIMDFWKRKIESIRNARKVEL